MYWSGGMPSLGGMPFRLCLEGGMPSFVGVLNSSGRMSFLAAMQDALLLLLRELANSSLSEKVDCFPSRRRFCFVTFGKPPEQMSM
eukprot:7546262-Heterocapsa_arctica.AAC.1